MPSWLRSMVLVVCAFLTASPSQAADAQGRYVFACDRDNDLFRIVSGLIPQVQRFNDPAEAVRQAPSGAAVLILAGGYPDATTTIPPSLFESAAKKKLRLYVEYPSALPGLSVGKPVENRVERAVVVTAFFAPGPKKNDLASINGLRYVPISAANPHLVAARVAGFDTAVYGLPKETHPLLFELPDRAVLVATTRLSHFVTGRFAPRDFWKGIWTGILRWLQPEAHVVALQWKPVVSPTYRRDDPLPSDYEMQAARRGVAWFEKARIVIPPKTARNALGAADTGEIDALPSDTPLGDGSRGSWEAVMSVIHHDGSQALGKAQRGDCIGETAMAFAFGGKLGLQPRYNRIASNLLDYYLFESDARKKERGDPNHGAYGLTAWGISSPAQYVANYGDDNARLMMAALATAALTDEDRWDEALMMCLLANLRTTGRLGFRGDRIDIPELTKNGWQHYFKASPVNYAPHFEAYLWACYLWAYQQTKYDLFLNRAETALRRTMDRYPNGWRWTNGLAQEKARILLPLAWLVRVKDTPGNRAMLAKAADGLLALQAPCGAIREELGLPEKGKYPPPRSNEEYGTNEASLIANNGDPVSDLLYTTNFAFLGLHEAAAATGEERIMQAENKLAEFLCRIQTRSDRAPSLDGGWYRAFDFRRWEHWGSNADAGWGAWCIESGWTQGWITAVLAMRQMNTSLWDLTKDSRIERHFDKLRKQMLPDDVPAAMKPKRVGRGAVGKRVPLGDTDETVEEREKPAISLTLIPPSSVTNQITLEIRGAVWNRDGVPKTFDVTFYVDSIKPDRLLHREQVEVGPNSAKGIYFRWPTKDHAGDRVVVLKVTSGVKTWQVAQPVKILPSAVRSTRRIGGAWVSFNLPEMPEGLLYDKDLAKMNDDQWRDLVRAMHEVGMDVIVIQESMYNHQHVGRHHIERDGYPGKAFYPSKLYPRRMPMASADPIEAVLSEADRQGMYVFVGCGIYAWFDFSPSSLKWHKALADELWERYGHHGSFYGWYVSEEIAGHLGDDPIRWKQIVDFFREFQAHVRGKAPDKPIMLATNSHHVPRATDTYRKLLPYLDILCPFGFDRMPADDITGEEAEKLLRGLCDEAGTHFWIDMELFTFGVRGELHPPPIRKVDRILQKYTDFERVLCFQYPGLMNAPWASIKPGGEPTVKLFNDYQTYLKDGLEACRLKHAAIDKPVRLVHPYSPRYTGQEAAIDRNRQRDMGGGDRALTDGWLGEHNLRDGWQGFWGTDLDATIDLGKTQPIRSIGARFLQETDPGVFFPRKIEFFVSSDGREFRSVATLGHHTSPKEKGPLTKTLTVELDSTAARYVRVHAENIGKIPDWHPAHGKKAWLFADEILVNPRGPDQARHPFP